MNIFAALDPSCFIWDREDFDINKTKYYQLTSEIIDILEIIEKENINIVIRQQLLNEIVNNFPAQEVISTFPELYDFNFVVYNFLSNLFSNSTEYNMQNINIMSEPTLIKCFYNETVKNEISYLLAYIYSYGEDIFFLTSILVCNATDFLLLIYNDDNKKIPLINNSTELIKICKDYENVFEPSKKHHINSTWGSRLKLHNDIVELLLQTAISFNSKSRSLVNYYEGEDIYIVFRLTEKNKYHAYPVNESELPDPIKNKLKSLSKNQIDGNK